MKDLFFRRISANLTLLITGGLLALSFLFGSRNYVRQRQMIVTEMDKALQETVANHAGLWLTQDTIRSCMDLQQKIAAPISIHTYNKEFAAALDPSLATLSGIQVHVLDGRKDDFGNELSNGYLLSDTIVWMTPQHIGGKASAPMISFRGFLRCTPWTILHRSDQRLSLTILACAFVFGLLFRFTRRREKREVGEKESITFGGLTLDLHDSSFTDAGGKRLHLSPMQYALMEMFYLAPTHQLTKRDICESLWPGKENADDTLYTLMRRLKPVIEGNSLLHIRTDRGRAYRLDLTD